MESTKEEVFVSDQAGCRFTRSSREDQLGRTLPAADFGQYVKILTGFEKLTGQLVWHKCRLGRQGWMYNIHLSDIGAS